MYIGVYVWFVYFILQVYLARCIELSLKINVHVILPTRTKMNDGNKKKTKKKWNRFKKKKNELKRKYDYTLPKYTNVMTYTTDDNIYTITLACTPIHRTDRVQ